MSHAVPAIVVTGIDTHQITGLSEHGATQCFAVRLMGTEPDTPDVRSCVAIIHPVVLVLLLDLLLTAARDQFPDVVGDRIGDWHLRREGDEPDHHTRPSAT